MLPSHLEKLVLEGYAQIFTKSVGFSTLVNFNVPVGNTVIILNVVSKPFYNNEFTNNNGNGLFTTLISSIGKANTTVIDEAVVNRLTYQHQFYNNQTRFSLTNKPIINFTKVQSYNNLLGEDGSNFQVHVQNQNLDKIVYWPFKESFLIQTVVNPTEDNSSSVEPVPKSIDGTQTTDFPFGPKGNKVYKFAQPDFIASDAVTYVMNQPIDSFVNTSDPNSVLEYIVPVWGVGSNATNGQLFNDIRGYAANLYQPELEITYALININSPTNGIVPDKFLQ